MKKYGSLIHNDAVIILTILIISIICEIIFETTSNYDYLILIILYLISICYDKTTKKKNLAIIMIIASLLLVIESIIDFASLFNVIFLLLGVISIYHSICYLKN